MNGIIFAFYKNSFRLELLPFKDYLKDEMKLACGNGRKLLFRLMDGNC
jgi:hypothetical protein